jgi:hypothetical protein
MTRIDKIPDITLAEVEALRSQNIHSITGLWDHISQDLDCGINNLADDTHIKKSRLVELLKAQALEEADRKGSRAGRHWLELAILALLLLILTLFIYASSTGVLAWIVSQ